MRYTKFSFTALDDAVRELRDTEEDLHGSYLEYTVMGLRADACRHCDRGPDTREIDPLLIEIKDAQDKRIEQLSLECLRLAVIIEHARTIFSDIEARITNTWKEW